MPGAAFDRVGDTFLRGKRPEDHHPALRLPLGNCKANPI